MEVLPVTDGLIGWYAARRLSLANNDPVSTWTDLSGLENHLTSASTNRPTFISPGPQGPGFPATIQFDGVNDLLSKSHPAVGSPTGLSIVIVYRTLAAGFHTLIATKAGSGNRTGMLKVETGSRPRFYETNLQSIVSSRGFTGALICLCARFAHNVSIDLDVFSVLPETQKPAATAPIPDTFNIGFADLGDLFTGYMSELLIFNRRLTDGERDTLENYLENLYGVGILVPASDAPDAPSDLTAAPHIDGITLHWRDNSTYETCFRVQQSFEGGTWEDAPPNESTDPNPTEPEVVSFFWSINLTPNGGPSEMALFRFRVRAENVYGESAWSNIVQVPEGFAALDPETGDTFIDPETGIPFVI